MIGDLVARLADRVFGPAPVVRRPSGEFRMARWTLWLGDGWGVYLHRLAGSDGDGAHDHPWPFVSVVLWGGYWETTTAHGRTDPAAPLMRRRYGPGRILLRPADRLHRVDVPPGRTCWTLFVFGRHRGTPTRFWCPRIGWVPWRPGIGKPGGCD